MPKKVVIPSRVCTKRIIPILKAKLSVEEMDLLAASVIYDTSHFVEGVTPDDETAGPNVNECEIFFNEEE